MGNKSTNPSKTNPQPISLTPTFLEFPLHTTKQFLGLGEDVLSLVLALVPPPQLFALARVCRCWYLLLRGDRVWCRLKRGTKDLAPSLTARQYWICLTIDVASESFGPTVNEVVAQVLRHTPGEDVELVAYKRLDRVGMDIGSALAERLTRGAGPVSDDVEAMRFVCKDFWRQLNGKTADRLLWNKNDKHMFRVTENSFRFLACASHYANTVLPSGMIKGALKALGYEMHVKCTIGTTPAAVDFLITRVEGLLSNSSR